MSHLAQVLLIGVSTGAVLALVAAGLTLIFGVLRTINFAHGEFYVLGGYTYVVAAGWLGIGPAALVAVPIVGYTSAWVAHAALFRPTAEASHRGRGEQAMIVTFALAIVVQNGLALWFGGELRRPPSLLTGNLELFGASVSGDRLAAAGAAAIVIAILWLVLQRTDSGRAWRAIIQNRTGAQVVGIDVTAVGRSAFAFACAIAAVAGALVAPLFGVFPTAGVTTVASAFIIIVLAGMGSVVGSLAGGLLVGLVNTLGAAYVSPDYGGIYAFALMILVLIARPRGLFGQSSRQF